MNVRSIFFVLMIVSVRVGAAQDHLPPAPAWEGASLDLMLDPSHEWATDFERSGGVESPDYEATVAWARKLVEASDHLSMVSLGDSPEGRAIWAILASGEGALTLEALRASDRPLVFAHSGIHSGEIDGKDAGFMLLRDMTVLGTKPDLLERVNFLFVPIFSVDGHERRSEYNRMNQRGPNVMGWRTTGRNLNLNRDYTKARALEMQHMLRALDTTDPDLYLDLHVTDGADYQYDITYGGTGAHGWSPSIGAWLNGTYRAVVDAMLQDMGHIPGPLIFTVDRADMSKGIFDWTAGPRFSNGYGDARHLPTILLENHSLKPYRQRVLGTYVFLEASLRAVADHTAELRAAIATDRTARPDRVHLDYARSPEPVKRMDFLAIRNELVESPITGGEVVRWSGEPELVADVPVLGNAVRANFVDRPTAYWIPAAWGHLVEILDVHGIAYERADREIGRTVEWTRFPDATMDAQPFEGQARVTPGEPVEIVREDFTFRPGAVRVPTDQELGTLAMILLEPRSPDGLFQWGFMLEVLQRTEYFETYAMEPLAREMLEADPALAAAFEQRLREDEEFADDPRARLEFFYERSPWYDREWKLVPVAREVD